MTYIPGFSGQAFGAGLGRDVRVTRQDQARQARELDKYGAKRGTMGKWGGRLASGLLGAALGSTLGPVGLMLAKSAGAGLGSWLGSSKALAGQGPSLRPGVQTGLGGSIYEQLGEAKGGLDEAMRGQALGAGAAELASGLTGMAGDKLGEAFKQTRAGVRMGELQSGWGKMLAEKGIKSGAQIPEGASGIFSRAGEFVPNQEVQSLAGSGLDGGFDWGDAGAKIFDPSSIFGQSQYDPLANYGAHHTAMPSQQGGYIPQYQAGGPTDMEMMRHTENLREKYGMEESPESYDWQKSPFEKRYGALKASEESERESSRLKALAELGGMGHAESARGAEDIYQQSLGDMDRGNIESLSGLLGKLHYTKPAPYDPQFSKINPELAPLGGELLDRHTKSLGELTGEEIPWEYLRDLRQGKTKNPYEDIVSGLGAKMPETMNVPRLLESSQGITDEGEGWDYFQQQRGKLGFQMGGMMPGGVSNPLPYNLGGSVAQQPMAYQLGGLLKYRRSPFG